MERADCRGDDGILLPGELDGEALDIVSVFEAVGAHARGTIDDAELKAIECNACPSEGACAGMFTANTMASVAEAIGMALPGSSTPPAPDDRRDAYAQASGEAVIELLRKDLTPRKIMTKEAFENAIAVVMALGGSTNAVLHLLAIANEAQVELALDDFNRVAARVPHIADTKPHGKYHMTDIDRIGGIPKPGDQVSVDGLVLTVESTDGRRVGKVLVVRAREADDEPDDDEADR